VLHLFSDPCVTDGCRAPYNTGCRVVNKTAQCICPTCPNVRRPVCASDDVQDLSECHLKQQACGMDIAVTVAKQAPCGMFGIHCRPLFSCNSRGVGMAKWRLPNVAQSPSPGVILFDYVLLVLKSSIFFPLTNKQCVRGVTRNTSNASETKFEVFG